VVVVVVVLVAAAAAVVVVVVVVLQSCQERFTFNLTLYVALIYVTLNWCVTGKKPAALKLNKKYKNLPKKQTHIKKYKIIRKKTH